MKLDVRKSPFHGTAAHYLNSILLGGVIVLGVGLPIPPASAQGFFDFLFGPSKGLPPGTSAYGDPNQQDSPAPRVETGTAYCVRLCDGRFFPIQRSSGVNPAKACSSVCPATRTKIFSGSMINHAVAADGSRYADLQNAFAFRDRIVANCTCNGKDAFGLVTVSANEDPTLRPGDIVATNDGFVAYNGARQLNARFTPVRSYEGLSAEVRQHLANAKITPSGAAPRLEPVPPSGDRRVQVSR